MAIFSPSESPAIVVKEIDLTGVVPNVQSTTGAIVGNYRWGPVREATLYLPKQLLLQSLQHHLLQLLLTSCLPLTSYVILTHFTLFVKPRLQHTMLMHWSPNCYS
jgi:hypothetical protein